jgi:hypothetical protein
MYKYNAEKSTIFYYLLFHPACNLSDCENKSVKPIFLISSPLFLMIFYA